MPLHPDPNTTPPQRIGAVAARFGLPAHVLRHWEDVGLLSPGRDATGRRVYRGDDLERIAGIVYGKEAGIDLDTLRTAMAATPDARLALARRHVRDLDARIAELTAVRDRAQRLVDALGSGDGDGDGCGGRAERDVLTRPVPAVGRVAARRRDPSGWRV